MEYGNPFDAPQGRFFILENALHQYSLWPESCPLPAGWQVVCEPAAQDDCTRWLMKNGNDIRPASFIDAGGWA